MRRAFAPSQAVRRASAPSQAFPQFVQLVVLAGLWRAYRFFFAPCIRAFACGAGSVAFRLSRSAEETLPMNKKTCFVSFGKLNK